MDMLLPGSLSSNEDQLLGLLIPGYTLHCIDPRSPAIPHSGRWGWGGSLPAWRCCAC